MLPRPFNALVIHHTIMGREIRRVPKDWEHPRFKRGRRTGDFHPLYDVDYETACKEWYTEAANFDNEGYNWYHEYAGCPPDEDYYRKRKWTAEEATHYQMYETVSEGTPVTPVFATKEELVDYLVENGTFWDDRGWDRKATESFVEREWAPSMIMTVSDEGIADIKQPRDGGV